MTGVAGAASTAFASALDFLVAEACALRFEGLPPAALTLVRQGLLDTLGVALAGRATEVSLVLDRAVLGGATPGTTAGAASVWGSALRTDPATATLVNATAGHALDYDDWAPGSGAHPSVTLVPTLLAAAELRAGGASSPGSAGHLRGPLTGREFITAYVAGYELQERIGLAISPSHYDLGFHTTAIVGTLGAAVAATLALGGDERAVRTALKIAATEAAGLKSMFGSMGKPLHAGRASAAGLLAAQLALAGFEEPQNDILFGEQGFAPTHSTEVRQDALTGAFGEPWYVESNLFKFFPSCFGTHAAIAAAQQIRRQPAFDAELVTGIQLTVPPIVLKVCVIENPQTGLEGKFSLAYTTAVALLTGEAGLSAFTDPFAPSPRLESLTRLVTLHVDDSFAKTRTVVEVEQSGIDMPWSADVDAGVQRFVDSPTEQQAALDQKFFELATPVIGRASAASLRDVVLDLDSCADVASLVALLH
ncbi:MAG: uncharacterized protein JWQ64_1600 [Subtercola sp.]|nr:uncharacterized protein [Subtercola sp.]